MQYAGVCYDGPLVGKSIAVERGTRFVVPSLEGYNAAGQCVFGKLEYRWSDERNGWVSEC